MGSSIVVMVTVLMVAVFGCLCESKCDIKGIFNFGDSNTDTGGYSAAFPAQRSPYGMTFFKKPVGRYTDGRVITDLLAQAIGIPFLSPYLRSIGSDFRHGVNYATAASTVRLPTTSLFVTGISPFSLDIQLNQMKEFRSTVIELQSHSTPNNVSNPLPPVNIFGKALYTIYIGQNDFTRDLARLGISGVMQFVPQVISQIAAAIKELYGIGGRTFWVLNLAPIGCYPAYLVELPHNSTDVDEFGCMISYNKAVNDYNNLLKQALEHTRADLPDASVIYVDSHSVLLDLFQRPKSYGMKYGTKACCGQGGEPYNYNLAAYCGNPARLVKGRNLTATACADPGYYVSWDGIHPTEVANKFVTKAILNESIFDPPFPLRRLCDLHSIR
ncbi:GDSL esterase/lipase At4g01130-like [Silene latifolia]|uniref:GDSL esterase/lipase At4g01130-like n=1 Tax=Silene latifolia TaxID=37657 RepID=UPI003D77DC05